MRSARGWHACAESARPTGRGDHRDPRAALRRWGSPGADSRVRGVWIGHECLARRAGIEYPLPPGAPGHETWGEVVDVAADVEIVCVGQTVTGLSWNGFAELGVGRAVDLVVVPDGFSAAGDPLACA
jgi:hypothetical protein